MPKLQQPDYYAVDSAESAAAKVVAKTSESANPLLRLETIVDEDAFIKYLTEHDCKHIRTSEGRNAVHFAAMHNFSRAIEWMAAKGYALNGQDNRGCTPLHLAAGLLRKEAVRMLLDKGANYLIRDSTGASDLAVDMAVSMADESRTEEAFKAAREISEMFPMVKSGAVSITFTKDDKGFAIIRKIELDRPTYLIKEDLAKRFEGGIIRVERSRTGYEVKDSHCIRHIHSIHSIAEAIKKEFMNKPYQAVIRLLCNELKRKTVPPISTIACADLLYKAYYQRCYDLDNLFIGDALENEAYGSLISQLVKLKLIISSLKFPISLPVVEAHRGVFAKNPHYREFYDASGRIRISNAAALEALYEIANHDDPEFATVPVPEFAKAFVPKSVDLSVAAVFHSGIKRSHAKAFADAKSSVPDKDLPEHLRPLKPLPDFEHVLR